MQLAANRPLIRCSRALLTGLFMLPAVLAPTMAPSQSADSTDKFRQLEEILPTPNASRTGAGGPGPGYWQQRCDYEIDVQLDDQQQSITGTERITYSDATLTAGVPSLQGKVSLEILRGLLARQTFDGSVKITSVQDAAQRDLPHTIVKTMMRVDLPQPLGPGQTFGFHVAWTYRINDARLLRGRTGYEFFEKDGNYIYEVAQWYPRLVAYTDVTGWQHKQYLGSGEFTLELGDFLVRITAPDDHIVAATGVLLNEEQVLTAEQRERLQAARTAEKPVFVVTPAEALQRQAGKPTGTKTWIFKADHVRDFAFASSRKFIWDAQGHAVDGNRVLAMSFYPNEAEPLWSKYSTHAIIHTLNVYSRYTFAYPYPVAISVNGPVYGMEYPMICFNGPRPEEDGTYSKRTKYGLISVVIHEVGHNYFPMIVNSDERQWTWMDEGLNTFLQYLAEQEWEGDYPSGRGEPRDIVNYMRGGGQVPIMTNSESILQFGNNAYAKPATALNILRETILGRELFDFAFRQYAERWRFKRPMPADFFRTMEDASGVDLDWFWRGWFYTTEFTDIAVTSVRVYNAESGDPDVDKPQKQQERDEKPKSLAEQRNKPLPKRIEAFPDLKDFYNSYDELQVTDADRKAFQNFLKRLDDNEKKLLESPQNFYVVEFQNLGGLVMPIILQIDYTDGSREELRIPAEIWRKNSRQASKLIITPKQLKSLTVDPHLETADVDLSNNHFPPQISKSRFQLFKEQKTKNEMQKQAEQAKP